MVLARFPEFFCGRAQLYVQPLDKGGVRKGSIRKLQADTEGTASVEYTVLMVTIAVSASAAIFAIGMPLVSRYQLMKLLIGLPLP